MEPRSSQILECPDQSTSLRWIMAFPVTPPKRDPPPFRIVKSRVDSADSLESRECPHPTDKKHLMSAGDIRIPQRITHEPCYP